MFVHREDYYHRGEEAEALRGQAEIIIAKQRNGPVGDCELVWERDFTRFSNKAPNTTPISPITPASQPWRLLRASGLGLTGICRNPNESQQNKMAESPISPTR